MRSSPTKILITGATGFIGRTLVARLQADGGSVDLRLPVRDRRRAERLGLPADRLTETTFADVDGLRAAADAVDLVVHLAGAVRAWQHQDMEFANVVAVRNLLAAVPATARVLLVSSLAAVGPSVDGAGTDAPPDVCRPCSHYGDSKRHGEQELLADAARRGRRWLVLRPCLVYGAGDGATALLFRQACGLVCPVPRRPRPLSTIDVRDVCAAIEAAVARPEVHGAFLPLVGEATDTHGLMRALAASCGRRARLLPVPDTVIAAAGGLTGGLARLRRRASYFSSDKAREIVAPGWVGDPEPARRTLGFAARIPLRDGLASAASALGRI
ncbi:MAG: NAD-dependent epimerase/dehydratase family protein [Planctomycetota bacterium]